MNQEQKAKIVESLAIAMEVLGQPPVSSEALALMASRLYRFDYAAVQKAISKSIDECKYKITVAEIIERIDDGRPTAEEAWHQVHRLTEMESLVMTEEQMAAFCSVSSTMEGADTSTLIACKQAFMNRYNKLVDDARSIGQRVKYTLSRGSDADGRLSAVMDAVAKGQLVEKQAVAMLPEHHAEIMNIPQLENKKVAGLIEKATKKLTA